MATQYYNDPGSPYHGQIVTGSDATGYEVQGYSFDGGSRGTLLIARGEKAPPLSATPPDYDNDFGSGYKSTSRPGINTAATNAAMGLPAPQGVAPYTSPSQSQSSTSTTQSAPKTTTQTSQSQPIDYTFHVGQETIEQYNQRIAQARGGSSSPTTAQNAPQQQQNAQQAIQPTGSIVDTLKQAGMDSSFAARQQLAAQYGIQGYTGTAAQNTSLEKKFIEAFNKTKGAVAPDSPADARTALQTMMEAQGTAIDPMQAFYSNYGSLDPITASLFEQIAQIDSDIANRPTYTQLVQDELAKSGVAPLKEDLAQTIADIRLTEDQVREELAGGGGLVLESQVRGVAAARTKVLLTKAEQLSNIISAKEEAVDRIVQLTQMDRAEVDAQMERKLGLTKMLYDMQTRMQDRARENYKDIINDVGYDGLVGSISSQQELQQVASALGMSTKSLLQLSTVQTSAQRKEELDYLNYQLSVDKFNEDKRQFGMQYALEAQKLANQQAAQSVSTYSIERANRSLDFTKDLKTMVSNKTVGLGSLSSVIPGTPAADFKAKLASLEASVGFGELQEMRDASKTGGALGQVAVKELELLSSSLGALSQTQSPTQFSKELQNVEDNIYRWNAQKLSIANGFDYNSAKASGYSDSDIFKYLTGQQ